MNHNSCFTINTCLIVIFTHCIPLNAQPNDRTISLNVESAKCIIKNAKLYTEYDSFIVPLSNSQCPPDVLFYPEVVASDKISENDSVTYYIFKEDVKCLIKIIDFKLSNTNKSEIEINLDNFKKSCSQK